MTERGATHRALRFPAPFLYARFMKHFHLFVALWACGSALPALAQDPGDEHAVRDRIAAYADARNRGDAHAEALCYTEDGDFRSSVGPFVSGRAEIEKQLTVNDPTYHFSIEITKLRFINPTTAIVDGEVKAGTSRGEGTVLADYVVVKQGKQWLIAAGRIAMKPPARPTP
jgi:uncharacterized protein (TIGR02246 family)